MDDSTAEIYDDFSIIATRNDGASIESHITNLGTGYAANFLKAPGEEGQIWIGGGYGLNLRTNTESNITFQTGGYSTPISMSILGSGDRSVEIYTNLNIRNNTVLDKAITVGAQMSVPSIGLIVNNSGLILGNLTVTGNTTVTGTLSTSSFFGVKPWVATKLNSGAITISGSPGFCQTGVTVNTGTVGTYTFTMPAHPNGTNYQVFVQQITSAATTAIALYGTNVLTSTSFVVFSKTTANAAVASSFYVYTLP